MNYSDYKTLALSRCDNEEDKTTLIDNFKALESSCEYTPQELKDILISVRRITDSRNEVKELVLYFWNSKIMEANLLYSNK